MTLEQFIRNTEDYESLGDGEKLLLKQLSIFHENTHLGSYKIEEIENAFEFVAKVQYNSQWDGVLYGEISKILVFLFEHLKKEGKLNG